MRELTSEEIEEVSGGVLNLATGAFGAGVGGLVAGGAYAINASAYGTFTWGGFAYETGRAAAAGFLIGTGASLIVAGATGAIPGAHVLGVTLTGTGAALEVATSVETREEQAGS